MSMNYDDPDRTPPQGIPVQGIPVAEQAGGRHHAGRPVRPAPANVDAWAAAEAEHRRVRQLGLRAEPGPHGSADTGPLADDGYDRFTPAATDPDGWSVAPAVIGGELPEAPPPPPRPVAPPEPPAPPNPPKRSFLGKLFNRDR